MQLDFIIVEVTRNILFYELDVLYIFDINTVCSYEIYKICFNFGLMNFNDTESLRILNFRNSPVGYENWYCFLLSSILRKKVRNLLKVSSQRTKKFSGYVNFSSFSEAGIQYLWQEEIGVYKVLVPVKILLVKNDYFLRPKFEFHRYQQMNGFLY